MEQPLSTKFYIPPLRSKRISRPRLIAQMNNHLDRKLMLISAPAGFGKTTLVSEWIHNTKDPVAWLSLDEEDSDIVRFLIYIILAVQTILPDIGNQALGMLTSPQPPAAKLILSTWINDIARIRENLFLVLDDYHVIDEPLVDDALTFLLENLPPQLHLIITTREDPQLPVARLRARNQLAELRATDLRFSLTEAASFLNEVMDLYLSDEEIAALESRTEGWVAGLQLAGISMLGHPDKARFIESFTGSHQFVMDFLVSEVLEQQSESIQAFLLKTSILDRLNGPLCDAVIGDPSVSGQETLEFLTQANLFLHPLDHERYWYRYHHLFADLIRRRLQENEALAQGKEGSKIPELHLRASHWFEDNGLLLEAFQHAAAANDLDRAECLMEGKGMPLQYRGAVAPILNWLSSLPDETLDARPALRVAYASTLTMLGKPVDNIEEILEKAELAFANSEKDEINRDYIGQIAAIRAMLAIPLNHIEEIINQSHRALEYLHPDNLPVRTNAAWSLGYAHQLKGERESAKDGLRQALSISEATGNIIISIASLTNLGQLYELENRLDLAQISYEKILELAGQPPLPFACAALIGLARISYEHNELDAAVQYARESLELALQLETVDTPALCHLMFARVKIARGDITGAGESLSAAEQFASQKQFVHQLPKIASTKARLHLQQGLPEKAFEMAERHDLPLIKARVFLARGEAGSALAVLEPAHREMESRCWLAELFEILLLEAIAYQLLGDKDGAATILREALSLAAPGNLIRSFLDEIPPIYELLSEAGVQPEMLAYQDKLLASFRSERRGQPLSFSPAAQSLVEPLSEREVEVLALIAQGYSNREIGERLFLALNTVKGHNRKLFRKLEAKNRTEAVAHARKLGLL